MFINIFESRSNKLLVKLLVDDGEVLVIPLDCKMSEEDCQEFKAVITKDPIRFETWVQKVSHTKRSKKPVQVIIEVSTQDRRWPLALVRLLQNYQFNGLWLRAKIDEQTRPYGGKL